MSPARCRRTGFPSQSRPLGFSCLCCCGWKRGSSSVRNRAWLAQGRRRGFAEPEDFPGSGIEYLQLAQRLSDVKDLSFPAGRHKEHQCGRTVPVANAASCPAGGRSRGCACCPWGLLRCPVPPCPCRVHAYAFQVHNPPLVCPLAPGGRAGAGVGTGSAGGLGRARCLPVPLPRRGFLQPGGRGTRFACIWVCLESL